MASSDSNDEESGLMNRLQFPKLYFNFLDQKLEGVLKLTANNISTSAFTHVETSRNIGKLNW